MLSLPRSLISLTHSSTLPILPPSPILPLFLPSVPCHPWISLAASPRSLISATRASPAFATRVHHIGTVGSAWVVRQNLRLPVAEPRIGQRAGLTSLAKVWDHLSVALPSEIQRGLSCGAVSPISAGIPASCPRLVYDLEVFFFSFLDSNRAFDEALAS